MTQEEFARRIGVSQGHFSYIECGEKEIGADILLMWDIVTLAHLKCISLKR